MNLQKLRSRLDELVSSLQTEDSVLLKARLEGLVSVFPFNEYEYILTFLVDRGVIHFSEYEELRQNFDTFLVDVSSLADVVITKGKV